MVSKFEFDKLATNQLSPILFSHGWIHLSPARLIDKGFEYSLYVNDKPLTVKVYESQDRITCETDLSLTLREISELKFKLSYMFSLNFPIERFKDICKEKKNHALFSLASKGWGRLLRSPTIWEDAVKTLCTTNASWSHTKMMCASLCKILGERTPCGRYTFPKYTQILGVGTDFLKRETNLGYRIDYIISLAKRFETNTPKWLHYPELIPTHDIAKKEINKWNGFGPYATNHLLVLLGFHRYLPVDREVAIHLGTRRKGSKNAIQEVQHYEEWGEFRFTAYKLTRVYKNTNWIGD